MRLRSTVPEVLPASSLATAFSLAVTISDYLSSFTYGGLCRKGTSRIRLGRLFVTLLRFSLAHRERATDNDPK